MNYQDRPTKQYICNACITDLDVISGRGSGIQNHIGNINYRAIVSSRRREYTSVKKFQKIRISKEIVATIRDGGGRFLELDKCTQLYYDIGDVHAVAKTSQALRDTKKTRQVVPPPSYTRHYQLTNISHAQNNVGEGADTYAKLVHILSGKKRKEEEEDGYHTTTTPDVVSKKKKTTKKSNHSFADKGEGQPSQLPSLPQLIQYTDSRNRKENLLQPLHIVPV